MIDNSTSCEICSVICFLRAKNISAVEIHRELCAVYGQNVMSEGTVRHRCRMIKDGRTDEEQSGQQSAVSDDLVQNIDQIICERRRLTISEQSCEFPQISHTVLYETITVRLGYQKFCARWILKMLVGVHRMQRMALVFTFLEQCHKDDEFLDHIVQAPGDKTWVSFVNVEIKEKSKQWMHTHSSNKLKKFKQTCARKLMATVFWDRKGVLVEFMQQRTTVMSEMYCKTVKKLCRAIQNRRHGMLTSSVVLLHDNALPHTAGHT
jgi:hypothetical protein